MNRHVHETPSNTSNSAEEPRRTTTMAATSSGASGQASMMKEYLRKQLRYWVENFRDDMLPRDFGAKSFSRSTISLHKIGSSHVLW